MKTYLFSLFVLSVQFTLGLGLSSAQDRAIFEVYSRYSPAVFSISVEIPKEFILKRYQDSINQLQAAENVVNASRLENYNLFDHLLAQTERQLNIMRSQMLSNNRVRGAGFAIDNKHLITLSTVVKSATFGGEIYLEDDNKNTFKARVKGMDDMTGVALLEVIDHTFESYIDTHYHATSLPIASYVMTIQRPYDLPSSPFIGMIGGYYRTLKLFEIEQYIQTDLELFPGNEGAPVFSPSGQLIGMMATRFNVGNWPSLSFVIPANIVVDSANELIAKGERVRGWPNGLSIGIINHQLVIESVEEGSQADNAGIKRGDRIVGFEDIRDGDIHDLYFQLRMCKPNQEYSFVIERDGNTFVRELGTSPIKTN